MKKKKYEVENWEAIKLIRKRSNLNDLFLIKNVFLIRNVCLHLKQMHGKVCHNKNVINLSFLVIC